MNQLQKDIRKEGKGGLELIKQVADDIKPMNGSQLSLISNEWHSIHNKIEKAKDLIEDGNRKFTEQAAQACKRVAIAVESGQECNDIVAEAHSEYTYSLWQSEIKDRLLLAEPENHSYLAAIDVAVAEEIEDKRLNGTQKPSIDETLGIDIKEL